MHLLSDESVHFGITTGLREAGHDVVTISEERPGSSDEEVIARARSDRRETVIEDRDFGRLVFVERVPSSGVIYLRYRPAQRSRVLETLLSLIDSHEDEVLRASFVALRPGMWRIDRLPREA